MKIAEITTQTFTYTSRTTRDSEGHTHPGPEHEARQTLLRIATDEGVEGYAFGVNPNIIRSIVTPMLRRSAARKWLPPSP